MDNKQNLENASESMRSGFDTAGNPIKKIGLAPIIGLVVILVIVFYFLVGSMFTPVRNCIGSISGAPECSDCTKKLMRTTLNGKSLGDCTTNPGTGRYSDQCTLNCPNK